MLLLGILLLFLGGFLISFGGWGIDFAHRAWEDWMPLVYNAGKNNEPLPPRPGVGLPFTRMIYVDAAFWWNINFFGGVLGGVVLAIIGVYLVTT